MARKKLTLQDVARRAADLNGGKGGRGLQRLADAKGLTLSYATVDRILAGKYESRPQRPTIEALASLAGMPLEEVYEAAGTPLPMAPLSEQLPKGSDQLTVDQRRVVLDVIRGFIRDNDRMVDLENERDARALPLQDLLAWTEVNDSDSLVSMDLDELQEMVDELDRAVPNMSETDTLVRYAVLAGKILDDRQRERETPPGGDEPARGGAMAGDPVQDGVTPTGDDPEQYPWEKPDFDLAANRGRNYGREARDRQDRDAEGGGA